MLYPFLHRFFPVNPPVRLDRNIELNMVVDLLALYAMKDDCAMHCRHFYCSAAGDGDRIEFYVIPNRSFPAWLETENALEKTAMMLSETPR